MNIRKLIDSALSDEAFRVKEIYPDNFITQLLAALGDKTDRKKTKEQKLHKGSTYERSILGNAVKLRSNITYDGETIDLVINNKIAGTTKEQGAEAWKSLLRQLTENEIKSIIQVNRPASRTLIDDRLELNSTYKEATATVLDLEGNPHQVKREEAMSPRLHALAEALKTTESGKKLQAAKKGFKNLEALDEASYESGLESGQIKESDYTRVSLPDRDIFLKAPIPQVTLPTNSRSLLVEGAFDEAIARVPNLSTLIENSDSTYVPVYLVQNETLFRYNPKTESIKEVNL